MSTLGPATPPTTGEASDADETAVQPVAGFGIIDRLIGRGDSGPRPATRRSDLIEAGVFALLVVIAVVVTVAGTRYRVQVSTDIAMFVTLAYSWNVISGFTGYISFGQVAFFGFGAYATSLLIIHAGLTWWLAAAVAAVMSGLLAIPLGMIMLRLRGIYFALGMFAIVSVLSLTASRWSYTGSGTGLILPGKLAQVAVFAAMIVAAVLAFGLNAYMSRSRFGLRAMSIRDDEEVASAMGVRATRVKVMAFALSATLPAFVGGLVAYNRSFINAASVFDPTIDLQTILFAMAGGIGTLWGPLIGAVSLELIGNQLWLNYPSIQLALFGALIILILLFLPGGVVSLFNRFGMLRRPIVKAPAVLPEGRPPVVPEVDGLRSEQILECHEVGVSFGGVHALQEVSLSVDRGETVCIIGANGAGKTTLVKLLCRLYEPTAGRLTVDGSDLAGVDHAAWRGRVAAIFQDFARYQLSARENVAMGAPHLAGDTERLREAARRAGALGVIEGLPRGWETVLSRAYTGGVDLSGGEWQRIALARALFAVEGGARILILDEPTAHLDVRAEAEIYDRFLELTAGLTTVVISHRFSTVRRANRIVVLEEGRVVEQGTHDQLVAAHGQYARLFRLQAERFADEGPAATEREEA